MLRERSGQQKGAIFRPIERDRDCSLETENSSKNYGWRRTVTEVKSPELSFPGSTGESIIFHSVFTPDFLRTADGRRFS